MPLYHNALKPITFYLLSKKSLILLSI